MTRQPSRAIHRSRNAVNYNDPPLFLARFCRSSRMALVFEKFHLPEAFLGLFQCLVRTAHIPALAGNHPIAAFYLLDHGEWTPCHHSCASGESGQSGRFPRQVEGQIVYRNVNIAKIIQPSSGHSIYSDLTRVGPPSKPRFAGAIPPTR